MSDDTRMPGPASPDSSAEFLRTLQRALQDTSAEQAMRAAAEILGRELGVGRVAYVEVDESADEACVTVEYLAEGMPSALGTYRIPELGPIFALYRSGEPLVVEDQRTDPRTASLASVEQIRATGVRSILDVPLGRNGEVSGLLSVNHPQTRRWTDRDIALARLTAEQTWSTVQRARTEAALRETSGRLQAILDNTTMAVFLMDHQQHCVFANAAAEALTGYRFEEMRGRPLHDVVHHTRPDGSHYPLEECPIDRAFPERAQMQGEELFVAPDGSFYPVAFTASPLLDDDGRPVGTVIEARNIAEEKAREEALRQSEQQARASADEVEAIYAAAPIGLTVLDTEMRYVRINQRLAEMNGLSIEEHIGRKVREVVPDLAEQVEAAIRRVLDGEEVLGLELTGITASQPGVVRTWRENWLPLRDRDGEIIGITVSAEEITGGKAAELALRASEERYRTLFESMGQGFCVIQVSFDGERPVDYRFTEINPAFTEQSGLGTDVLNKSIREAVPGLEEVWFRRYGEIARTGEPQRFIEQSEVMGRWFEVYAFRIGPAEDRNVAILFTDITSRVQQEQALKASEARLRAVIDSMPVGLVFADADGRITGGNHRVEEIIGQRMVESRRIENYAVDYLAFHADGRQVESEEYPLARVLRGEAERPELECLVQRQDGSRHWVRYVAAPIVDEDGEVAGGVVASVDIDHEKRLTQGLEKEVERVVAEREAAQEALRQSQKLEAMGQLTGGVAHDFNNLLTPIIGSLDLLQRKGLGDARTQRLIDGAIQSAERAKILVQRLLAFARRQPLRPTAIDVGRIVGDMSELIASTSGPRIRLQIDVEPDLPAAHGDSNQLEMALLNLAVNARDAMADGGTLAIRVRAADQVPEDLRELGATGHVVLSVTDSGVGMDEETLARCIEPFFSTKGIGKGTGLGLSMVHGLAAQLGGAMRIQSRQGVGTVIELWLPVSAEALSRNGPMPTAADRGEGTVLLVDDEELVRMSTASMLGDLGYHVVEAGSGEEAIRLVKDGLSPDLLVSDHLMPGLSGTDLAVRLRRGRPGLPVLIVSGYADVESLSPAFPRLTKPFRQAELAAAVRAVRGEPVQPPAIA